VVPARPVEEVQLPFVMEMARPRKMRLELEFNGQKAIQVFDGTSGWKVRPFLNRSDAEPFTTDELKAASLQPDLDGPLVDYAAKGTKIELAGMEKVENRNAYKLKVTPKNGLATHVWIDAQTFLEAKMEGQPRRLDGVNHTVEIYYRDYRPVSGLQIPFVLETRVLPVAQKAQGLRSPPVPPEKITLDKVVVNPTLEASRFSKPQTGPASKAN
jgi:outer membrane lipoprotein-sorting protein